MILNLTLNLILGLKILKIEAIMINNWKYNEWLKLGYQYHAPEDYISMEIYPEDIEMFSKILLLDTIEHKGRIIKVNPSSTEEETKKDFDKQIVEFGIDAAEKIMNLAVPSFIFFHTSEKTSSETFMNIIRLIKNNWKYCLEKKYPDKTFEFVICEDEYEPSITFYVKRETS